MFLRLVYIKKDIGGSSNLIRLISVKEGMIVSNLKKLLLPSLDENLYKHIKIYSIVERASGDNVSVLLPDFEELVKVLSEQQCILIETKINTLDKLIRETIFNLKEDSSDEETVVRVRKSVKKVKETRPVPEMVSNDEIERKNMELLNTLSNPTFMSLVNIYKNDRENFLEFLKFITQGETMFKVESSYTPSIMLLTKVRVLLPHLNVLSNEDLVGYINKKGGFLHLSIKELINL